MANPYYDMSKAKIEQSRSLFRIPHNYKTTLNAGDLIPVCQPIEVVPGDTFKIDISAVCRELTLLNPVMDNSYLEINAFYVPMHTIWDNTKQFFGENETGIWDNMIEREMPSEFFNMTTGDNTFVECSIGDYFGIFSKADSDLNTFNTLPLRAYAAIYNYWYLNEATQAPILFSKADNNTFGEKLQSGYASKPLKVNRYADLFTSCLPAPQKGQAVSFLPAYIPVIPNDDIDSTTSLTPADIATGDPMRFMLASGTGSPTGSYLIGVSSGGLKSSQTSGSFGSDLAPSNLYASTAATSLHNINEFRIAAATQQYLERLAQFGSRYEESIYALFGVKTPFSAIQVPQYLGGYKHLLNVDQVLATSEGAEFTLGSTGAYSHSAFNKKSICTFSSFDYGYIIILSHIRTDNTYSQGVPKLFSKKTKYEVYNPLFANIGNVPVKNKEIFITDTEKDDEVFGYQEAWYEYKFMPNLLTGYMRPQVSGSFNTWTYGRVFEDTPVLNEDFTLQTEKEVDRTIAVQSDITNQFKLDIFFNIVASRVMPVRSVPGLKRI